MALPELKPNAGGGHGDDEKLERWLLTYADMITLLMAFFIMMYAMSIVNLGKFSEFALSVRTGFGGERPAGMVDRMGLPSGRRVLPSVLPASAFDLMTKVAGTIGEALPAEDRNKVEFLSEGGTVTIRVRADDVLFARGSAELTARARRILDSVADAISSLPYPIRVEGHTCDLPIHTARFPSNWELSAQRAINVVLYFIREHGFPPAHLSAVGYADTMPAVPNTSEAERARNRRIDIVLLRTEGPAAAVKGKPASGATPTPVEVRPGPVQIAPLAWPSRDPVLPKCLATRTASLAVGAGGGSSPDGPAAPAVRTSSSPGGRACRNYPTGSWWS